MHAVVPLLLLATIALAEQRPLLQSPELLMLKRIHIEELTGGETADQIRDMLIASIQRTGLFVLTENAERADAILRGSAEDLIYTETHDTHDSINARGSVNLNPTGSSSSSRSRSRFYVSSQVGENEGSRTVERKHEAMAAVRLVNLEGDVIWSTVQESRGAKLRGASADVAQKVTKQLLKDCRAIEERTPAAREGRSTGSQ
jgi:hypothetical protein